VTVYFASRQYSAVNNDTSRWFRGRHDEEMQGMDLPTDGSIVAFTAEERPDLWEDARSLFLDVWPEYNNHGNDSATYFAALFPQYAQLQILFFDRNIEQVVARGRTIPFRWDGSLDDLPQGIDDVGLRAVNGLGGPTALSALAAEVTTDHQGRGLSRPVLQAMAEVARRAELFPVVAPVRSSWKDRYPLIPIERYAYWERSNALPFDLGYECMHHWVRLSCGRHPSPCESKGQWTIGSAGPT
jgi:GNAT superfamily N-acetyltransferase